MTFTNVITRPNLSIELTEAECQQIYYYQQHRFHMQDAESRVIETALEYCDLNSVARKKPEVNSLNEIMIDDISDDCSDEDRETFERLVIMDQEDFENLATLFEEQYSCNADEYSQWACVIENYINDAE